MMSVGPITEDALPSLLDALMAWADRHGEETLAWMLSCRLATLNHTWLQHVRTWRGMLTTLDLSCGSISSESVQEVARRCPRLDCLLLSRRSEMEIPSVAASARLVWTCGSKYLDQWACQQVSLESMKALAMGCTRLRSLDLSMCTQMTGEGVWHLMQHCSLLVNLDLSYASTPSTPPRSPRWPSPLAQRSSRRSISPTRGRARETTTASTSS